MARRLIVTGASGLLGWNVAHQAIANGWDVVGIRRTERASHARAPWRWATVDLAASIPLVQQDDGDLGWFDGADAIIHCAAQANAGLAEKDPAGAAGINVDSPAALADLARRKKIRMVQISTDLVFDGESAPYDEQATPSPLSVYGRQKANAEHAVLENGGVVCRLPLLLGVGSDGPSGPLRWLLEQLQSDGARLFTDEFRTPLTAQVAAAGLLLAVEQADAVWHLSGSRVSRHELGCKLAEAWQIPLSQVIATTQQSMTLATPRPKDVSMTCERAKAAGFSPPSLDQQLLALHTEVGSK